MLCLLHELLVLVDGEGEVRWLDLLPQLSSKMVARLVIPASGAVSRWTIDLIVSTGRAATRLAETI